MDIMFKHKTSLKTAVSVNSTNLIPALQDNFCQHSIVRVLEVRVTESRVGVGERL